MKNLVLFIPRFVIAVIESLLLPFYLPFKFDQPMMYGNAYMTGERLLELLKTWKLYWDWGNNGVRCPWVTEYDTKQRQYNFSFSNVWRNFFIAPQVTPYYKIRKLCAWLLLVPIWGYSIGFLLLSIKSFIERKL